jgi:hypothetical protein
MTERTIDDFDGGFSKERPPSFQAMAPHKLYDLEKIF